MSRFERIKTWFGQAGKSKGGESQEMQPDEQVEETVEQRLRREEYDYLRNHPVISLLQYTGREIQTYNFRNVHLSIVKPDAHQDIPVDVKLSYGFTSFYQNIFPGMWMRKNGWKATTVKMNRDSLDGSINGIVVFGEGTLLIPDSAVSETGQLPSNIIDEFEELVSKPAFERESITVGSLPQDPREEVTKGIREEINFEQG